MNPKNHLINDYLKTLSESLVQKGYDNEDLENILTAVEAQVLDLGGNEALTKQQELEIISSLSSIDSYPHCNSNQEEASKTPASEKQYIQKLKKSLYTIVTSIILILLGLVLFTWGTKTQRRIVTYEESVKATRAQIDNVLQRRYDLIPNLVNTVKGYADHEKELFTEIARLRSNWGKQSGDQRQETASQLEGSINKLMFVVESYPVIKSDQIYQNLMMSLESTENRISVERMRHNESIRAFNSEIRKMPQNIIASWMGATQKDEYLKANKKVHTVHKVTF